MVTHIEVERANLTRSRIARTPDPVLADGQVLARIDSFALTANNVTYGVAGDMIGYWRFFPAQDPWGVIPVWGFATVTASLCPDLRVGERFWGFLPMADALVLTPGAVSRGGFTDTAPHRADLPALYNRYQFTANDPPALAALEAERCALFPLFNTAYVIADLLADNAWFGARQVVVLSASSKTGFGLTNLLARVKGKPVRVVGVTSPANRAFVTALGGCDEVIAYDRIDGLDPTIPTIVVDMAGSAAGLRAVHTHFGQALVYSCSVGITHWTEAGDTRDLPGAAPTFFFAPAQIAKRDADWGPGEVQRRAQAEAVRIAGEIAGHIRVERIAGPEACRGALDETVAGKVSPDRILLLSLT